MSEVKPVLKTLDRKEYNKKYYEINKEKFITKATAKVKCNICNKEFSSVNYPKHLRTDKHSLKESIYNLTDKK